MVKDLRQGRSQNPNVTGDIYLQPLLDRHLTGFVVITKNGVARDGEDTVFISHGWGSMRIATPLSDSYVQMRQINDENVFGGDG